MNYEFSPWLICAVFSLTGGILGATLDLYRTVRYFGRPGKWMTAFGDILYWTMVTSVLVGLFGTMVNGELRFYFFLFLVMGLGIYYCLFSHALLHTYRLLGHWMLAVIRAIFQFVGSILGVILYPLAWLSRIILVPITWVFRPFVACGSVLRKWWDGRRPRQPPME